MTYTKQHFEGAAELMRGIRPPKLTPGHTWTLVVARMADVFARSNPRFNRERFIRACGGE